jgi:hypothetical protein
MNSLDIDELLIVRLYRMSAEFSTTMGRKPSVVYLPYWRKQELRKETQKFYQKDSDEVSSICGMSIVWHSKDYIELSL